MTPSSPNVPSFVFHDREVPECLKVSVALHLPLWGRGSKPLGDHDRLVLVLKSPKQAHRILRNLRSRAGRAPALVVAWGLPERQVADLLNEAIPVVDASLIDDPTDALMALKGEWDCDKFAQERTLAEALAAMEAHLAIEGQEPPQCT